jgi:alpha-1,2-mannosyltransferase
VSVALALALTFVQLGYPLQGDYSKALADGVEPDVLHEQATAWEALYGDSSRPLSEVMIDRGYPDSEGGPSPRTPAALLFQLPLLLISDGVLMWVVTTVMLGLLAVIAWLTQRISGLEPWRIAWAAPLVLISFPLITGLPYASVTALFTVTAILLASAFQDRSWAGIPLGLAAASRLWPGLIIIGFWVAGRRKAAYVATGVFVVISAAGLLLPGVTLEGSIESLTGGPGHWLNTNLNFSLALVMLTPGVPAFVVTAVMSALGLLLAWRNKEQAIPITILTALLASPLSWPIYSLVALPAAAMWWREERTRLMMLVAAPLILWMIVPSRWIGHVGSATILLLLIAIYRMDEVRVPAETTQGLPV